MRKLLNLKPLERKEITEIFQEALDVHLLIVVAAMGYGKSTIVKNFLEKFENKNVAWLSLGENETDDIWLWQRLCEKIKENGFPFYKEMEALGLPSNAHQIDLFINMIRDSFSIPFFLIFDDYHECNSPFLNRLIEILTYEEIPNLYICIISRFYPDIPYEEMYMKGYCMLLGQRSFILTKNEIDEFFQINGQTLAEEELNVLYRYTDGWMSAVYLALLDYIKNGRLEHPRNIAHFLQTSFYDKLSDSFKNLFMKMSLFDHFTAKQAAYITKTDLNSAVLYEHFKNMGFIKVDSLSGVYEMHSLLKTVASIELEHSGIDKQELYARCGEWYENNRDYILAIKYHQKAGNTEQIFKIIEQRKCYNLFQKAPILIKDFFEQTDLRLRLKHPAAYFPYIYLLIFTADYSLGLELFHEAKNYFETQYFEHDKNAVLGELLFIEALSKFNNLEDITQLLKNAYTLAGEKNSSIFDSQVLLTYGVPEILTLYHSKAGSLSKTLQLEKEYSYYYMRFIKGVEGGWDHLYEAEYQYTTGNIEKAKMLAKIAAEKSIFRKQICLIISSLFTLLRCNIFLGEKEEFEQTMEELTKHVSSESRPHIIIDYELARSFLYGSIGQHHKMAAWLRNFQLSECNIIMRSVRCGCVSYGLLLIKNKQWIQLEALAEEMLVPYHTSTHIYAMISAWIFKAVSSLHLYDLNAAVKSLANALMLAEPDQIKMPFVENSSELIPILSKTENKNNYVQSILALIQQYQKGKAVFLNEPKSVMLTPREIEFMELVILGYKNTEISTALNIALVTVEKTLSNIYRKLNVSNRTAAVSKYQELKKT